MSKVRLYLSVALGGLLAGFSCGQQQTNDEKIQSEVVESVFLLGNLEIRLKSVQNGEGPLFLNVHENENTSVAAAHEVVKKKGGSIYWLNHTGNRNISFRINDANFIFDPNRMFTDVGAEASLRKLSTFQPEALTAIRSFADSLTKFLDRKAIYTLHNNTEGSYSAESYLKEYANEAADVYLNPNHDPDDFFFVTTKSLFDKIKNEGFNVVLQNNEGATDDGSLSVLAAQWGIPYVNVEAQHGHVEQQKKMIELIYSLR